MLLTHWLDRFCVEDSSLPRAFNLKNQVRSRMGQNVIQTGSCQCQLVLTGLKWIRLTSPSGRHRRSPAAASRSGRSPGKQRQTLSPAPGGTTWWTNVRPVLYCSCTDCLVSSTRICVFMEVRLDDVSCRWFS